MLTLTAWAVVCCVDGSSQSQMPIGYISPALFLFIKTLLQGLAETKLRTMKIKLPLSFLFFTFLTLTANAQADLKSTVAVATPNNISVGDILNLNFNVVNGGNVASTNCYVNIYISPTNNIASGTLISVLSLEALQPNGVSNNQYNIPLPYNTVKNSVEYIIYFIDAYNQVPESNENNNAWSVTTNVDMNFGGTQNLPYPMIFIHGLSSNNIVWYPFIDSLQDYFGWSYGGQMDFCLNQDADKTTSIMANDYMNWTDNSSLVDADMYTINFDVNPNGTPYSNTVESNQSAIKKQGLAVKDAISTVLQKTGKDKVILVGHSMGGLASREYLEDPNIWQLDGQHHVAKLLTVGTPHGGSDAVTSSWFGTPDGQSEAVRDLRTDYFYSGNQGVYLSGGIEDKSYMNDQACCYFYNADVNCNGITGETITGINSHPTIVNDLAYSCIIGDGSTLGGDGVVTTYSSNLNNFYTLNADTFLLVEPSACSGCTWHQELPAQVFGNVQGIDEPNSKNKSYEIFPNNLYFGNITKISNWWALSSPSDYDHDWFKFNLPSSGMLSINIYNISIPDLTVKIYNPSSNVIATYNNSGKSNILKQISVSQSGYYYMELSGEADDFSWNSEYGYSFSFSNPNSIDEFSENIFNATNYPNPFKEKTTISFSINETQNISLKVYNPLGEEISDLMNTTLDMGKYNVEFDGTNLSSGIYYYILQGQSGFQSGKLVIEK